MKNDLFVAPRDCAEIAPLVILSEVGCVGVSEGCQRGGAATKTNAGGPRLGKYNPSPGLRYRSGHPLPSPRGEGQQDFGSREKGSLVAPLPASSGERVAEGRVRGCGKYATHSNLEAFHRAERVAQTARSFDVPVQEAAR